MCPCDRAPRLPDRRHAGGRAGRPRHAAMGPGVTSGARERRWTPSWPVDLSTTLGVLGHGRGDPTIRIIGGEVWRATRTPAGPATIHYRRDGSEVLARAWGPGAEHELEALPRVLGADDDPAGFDADAHPVMAAADRRFGPGWRVLRTERVLEALVPAVLEQRVTGREASRAWAELVREVRGAGPGSAGSGRGRRGSAASPGCSWPRMAPAGRGSPVGPGIGRGSTRDGHARSSRRPGVPRPWSGCPSAPRPRPGGPCARCPGSGSGRLPRSGSVPGGIATRCPSATSTSPGRSCTP